jgi:hypothetical protein
MGIDIYMQWDQQTDQEKQAQITGFSIEDGDKGYLREAYHGEPYATKFLVREAFASKTATAKIRAAVLRSRLAETQRLAIKRAKKVYNESCTLCSPEIKAFADFVKLAEKVEAKTGKPVTIIASY